MLNDLRFALRTFARQPSYAFAAVATLALGIAVNTVAFTALDALVLRPMPVPGASRVVRVYPVEASGRRMNLFSYPDYLDYRAASTDFDTLAAYIPADVTAGRASLDRGTVEPRPTLAYVVSASYFDLTGVRASSGRVLGPDDERRGMHSVVLGQTFWRTRFGADPSAIGSTVALNGTAFTIVGIAAAGFAGTEPLVADCWIPLVDLPITTGDAQRPLDRAIDMLLLAGRLRPGVSRASAARQMSLESARLALAYPGRVRPASVTLEPGTFFTFDPGLVPIIGGSLAVVALVLFIACANATNLALARMASRRREIALRLALGASRGRIVRQLLVESMTIALTAGVVALVAAEWALRALYRIGVSLAALPWAVSLNLAPDIRVLAWTASIALLAGAALGLLPALQSSGRMAGTLNGLGLFGGRIRGAALRDALVIAQVAASVVLLFGAGLLLRALASAEALDLGFKTSGVVYADYDPGAARYTAARAGALNRALLDSARSMPGVTAAALTSHVPLHGGVHWTTVRLPGTRTLVEAPHAIVSSVSPGYFAVLQIPFVAGRSFDAATAAPSAIISEGLARRFWPGESAIGRSLTVAESPLVRTVVGVVRDAANGAIWRDKELAIYVPIDGSTDPRDLRIVVRTTAGVPTVAPLLAARAAALDSDLRFAPVALDELLRLWRLPSKIAAASLAVLAVMALTLACIGVYGVISFAVHQRMREIGIRMVLGADPRGIVRLILRDGWRLVAAGLVVGGACAVPVAPILGRLLFGVSPFDPLTMAVVPSLLSIVALGASYLPARRASRLQPLAVLRVE